MSIFKNTKALIGIAALIVVLIAVVLCLVMCKPAAEPDPTEEPTAAPTEPVVTPDPTEPVELPPDTETKTLDAMDEVGAWIGTNPSVRTDADGKVWLGTDGRDDQGSAVMSRAFDPALDLRGYANGWLKIRIYVEDISKLAGGELELSSSGGPDNRELSWNLMLYLKKSGWNEIALPLANANRVGGEIDLKKVNFMRIYAITDEGNTIGADEIVLTNEEPEAPSHLDEKGQFVLDEVESMGAWIGTAPYLVSKKAPVGTSYLYTETMDGDAFVLTTALDNLDASAFKNGYLHMWIYVKTLSQLTGGQIELTSAGIPDKNETGWDLLAYVTKDGWNEVYLPIADALKVSGGADFSKLNFIRVYALSKGSNGLGVDYLALTNDAPPEPSRIDANNQYVIDKVEAIETWVGSKPYLASSGAAVGKNWLATKNVDEAGSAVFTRLLTNLDASAYKNGYLHMWLYVEDVDQVTGGQIELSSSGEPDKNETSWNIGGVDLKDGWNELYIPIKDATKVGGGANFRKLNFIRIYVTLKKATKVGIDYIALSRTAPERDDPIDENGNYIIDHIKGVSPWSGSALVYNTANGYGEGADWLSSSSASTQDMVFFRNFATADLTAYAEGYLHLWLYVDDISHVTGGMVEISSAGTVDDQELYWPIASHLTKSGWNELYLPLKDAFKEGAAAADLAKMNTIRVVVMLGASGGNTGIDEVYVTNTKPEAPAPEFDGIIDPINAVTGWEGTPLTYHANGGCVPVADYISSEITGAGDLVFARLFPNANATAFAEGGLQLWVYVEDVSKLTGGMIEITSAGTVDNQELWWPIANYVTESGWNLVYLPFADAQKQGTEEANMQALNYIRVVMGVSEGGVTGGIDEVQLVKAAPGSEKIYIVEGENLNGLWGSGLELVEGNAPVGNAYIKTGVEACPVICAGIIPAVDIRGYEHTGELHMKLYVEDVSKIVDGQIELTSSGLSDDQETAWNFSASMLQNGWNDLTLNFSDAVYTGTTNYGGVNYMRLYINFTQPTSIAIDEIYVGGIKANITVPEDTTTIEEAKAAAAERSVLYEGSENMKAAIAAVIAKAKAGESVTLVTLGDSITAGAVAPVGLEWASLVKNYLEGLDGDPNNGNVTLVNAGIGSTEAVLGVSRVEKDVLSKNPDLVVVDFGTNDYGLPYGAEAYEGILCKLIGVGVPVINSNVCPANGNNIQDSQLPINKKYGVPMISFKTAYYELSNTTTIIGLRNRDIWSSDTVHPTTEGHALLAELLTGYMQKYIVDAAVASGTLDTELPNRVTNNGFADAILVENFTETDKMEITMNGWTGDYAARIYQLSTEGWQTSTVGSSISFKVNAGYFYMFFELDSNCGDLEIAVDGTVNSTINWAYLGTGYMNAHHILHLGEAGEHTVTITLRDNANVENDWAGICAVGAANFSGISQEELPSGVIDMVTADSLLEGAYQTEGGYKAEAGWSKIQKTDSAHAVFYKVFTPLDLSDYAEGYLHLWLYVDDVANLAPYAGMIELTSGGVCDTEEIYWELHTLGLESGWNELYLPITGGTAQGGTIDMSQVDCLRIVGMPGATGAVFGIDEIYVTNEKPEPPADSLVISEIESKETWDSVNGLTVHDSGAAVGNVWVGTTTDDFWPQLGNWLAPVDISAYAEGYLHMWIYVPNAAGVVDGFVELSSAAAPDASEIAWAMTGMGLKDGWNEVYLPVAEGIKTDGTTGPVDLSNINFIRVYTGNTAATTLGIDKMEVTLTKPEAPEPEPEGDYIISNIEDIEGWSSLAGATVQTGNAAVGEKWIQVGTAGEAPNWATVICYPTPFDITSYDYLRVRIYMPSVGELHESRIELCSGGGLDSKEISWNLSGKLEAGWNDVYLPITEGVKTGDVDLTKIDTVHIALLSPNGMVGIDQILLTNTPKTEPEPEPDTSAVIDRVTETSTLGGTYTAEGGYEEGAGWSKIQKTDASHAVYYKVFAPMDLSAYANGYLHLWLYIDNVANLAPYSGMIELTSAGAPDNEEIYWTIHGLNLKSGWNELHLKLTDGVAQGDQAFNITQVDCLRIVGMPAATGAVFGIDEIYLTNDYVEQIDPAYTAAVEQANETAIVYAGSDNMKSAIAAVLAKAKAGEAVKLVVSGSSTPAGAGADTGKGLADHIRNWLDELDGQNNGNVTLVNTAIGSTENVFGVSRMDKDILAHDPDLVLIDFGNAGPHMKEAHEGVLTKLIKAGKPTICLCGCPANGTGDKENYLSVNEAYGVPHLDFKTSFLELSKTTTIAGLTTADIYYADMVHPSNAGHKLLAGIVINYLQKHILDANVASGTLSTTLPEKVTNNGFADAILVENNTVTDKMSVTLNGWTGDYSARIYQLSTEGWQTSTVGSTITFKVNGGYFYMFFELDSNCGDLEIAVDGQVKGTINWACNGTGYMNPYYVYNFAQAGEHTVTMTLKDNATVENDWFGICAVGASNFEGYEVPVADTTVIVEGETVSPWFSLNSVELISTDAPVGSNFIRTVNSARDPSIAAGLAGVDISGYLTSGYLHFWLYVEDASALTGGQIELNSNGTTPNQAEIAWNLTELGLKNGWNELYLPFADAVATDGTSGAFTGVVKYIRIWTFTSAEGKLAVDKMEAVKTAPETPEPEPPASKVISEVESQETWFSADGITVHNEGAPVGNVWLEVTNQVAYPVVINGLGGTPVDISAYAEGYLHTWIYVPNAAGVVDGFIELSSAGTTDKSEIAWAMTAMGLKDGWNEVYLSIADATRTDGDTGPVDLSKINFIRIYTGQVSPSTFGFDKLEVTLTKPEAPEPDPEPAGDFVISEVESVDGWDSLAGLTLRDDNAPVGEKWIQAGTAGEAPNWATIITYPAAFDISGHDYLRIRIYMPAVGELNESRIELCSGGLDTAEISWNFANFGGLQAGWNDVYLPIAEGTVTGSVDLTAINCVHIALLSPNGMVGFDKIELTNTPKTEPEPDPEPDPEPLTELDVDLITGITPWFGTPLTYETANGYKEGAGWLKTQVEATGDTVHMRTFTSTDVSDFVNGYLYLRLYVDDVAKFRPDYSGMIEIASIAGVDDQELYWDLGTLGLVSGWNELYLPLNAAKTQGATAFNPEIFQCIRIVGMFGATGGVLGVDEIRFVAEKPVADYVISSVDTLDAWFGAAGYGLMPDAAVGDAWMKSPTDGWPAVVSAFTPFDISAYAETGYLHLWVYIPNGVTVAGGQIELSSASAPDASEIGWNFTSENLKSGWNELYLPMAEGIRVDGSTGPVDLTKINYIRIYVGMSPASWFGFDKIEVTETNNGTGSKYVISEVETTDLWFGADGYGLVNGAAVGNAWMKSPVEGWPAVVSAFNPTFDVTPYAEAGYLHTWIYVPAGETVVGGQLELSSASSGDQSEIGWNLADYNLTTGWNEVYLPFSQAIKADGSTGPVDLAKINYIRIYLGLSPAGWFGFDKMELTMNKP